jgi:hypothetical protein
MTKMNEPFCIGAKLGVKMEKQMFLFEQSVLFKVVSNLLIADT